MEQEVATQVVGLGGSTDFSLIQLFLRADFVVKAVIIILIAASVYSWALIFDKYKLFKKIEKRVEKMFNDGAVDEVKKFCKMKVNKELSSNKIIGIKEIRDYLKGKTTAIKAKELISQKTRQYAKRQFTWARGHMKSWERIYSPDTNDLFKKVVNKIS